MKILIVFYSKTNITKELAEDIFQKLSDNNIYSKMDIIIDKKNRKGVFGFIIGGRDAMKKNLTEITYNISDVSTYDMVLIGTPVWANTLTPAVRTYLEKNKQSFKRVSFFSTAGGEKFEKTFKDMQDIIDVKPESMLGIMRKQIHSQKIYCQSLIDQYVSKITSLIRR